MQYQLTIEFADSPTRRFGTDDPQKFALLLSLLGKHEWEEWPHTSALPQPDDQAPTQPDEQATGKELRQWGREWVAATDASIANLLGRVSALETRAETSEGVESGLIEGGARRTQRLDEMAERLKGFDALAEQVRPFLPTEEPTT